MRFKNYILTCLIIAILYLSACAPADGNRTGSEYMMDMGHSIAYETNTSNYYKFNTWGTEEEYHQYVQPRLPQKGTIPRGYVGLGDPKDHENSQRFSDQFQGLTVSGFVPYYYENTDEDRVKATSEITMNPFPITANGLAQGKALYDIYCGICHGPNGDGNGFLVREDGGVYPAQPISLVDETFTAASNGRFYHSIMYGINVMGPYADKLSYEERWQVIHYIRSLQAKEQKMEYSEMENTLNNFAVPGASLDKGDVENGI